MPPGKYEMGVKGNGLLAPSQFAPANTMNDEKIPVHSLLNLSNV
jgi:hypothetical protein